MEVLHRLIGKAAQEGILSLPASPAIHHRCSVYADNVMLFLAPKVRDVVAIRELLLLFANASGLQTNLHKSLIAPIACSELQIGRITNILLAHLSDFPIQYLGLPLSTGLLRKVHFQPLVDKISRSYLHKFFNKADIPWVKLIWEKHYINGKLPG